MKAVILPECEGLVVISKDCLPAVKLYIGTYNGKLYKLQCVCHVGGGSDKEKWAFVDLDSCYLWATVHARSASEAIENFLRWNKTGRASVWEFDNLQDFFNNYSTIR